MSRNGWFVRAFACACVLAAVTCTRCGGHQEAAPGPAEETRVEAAPAEPVRDPVEQNVAEARLQVVRFLEDVRAERYEQAYATSSPILTGSYTYQQFLMTAGKLQMEELPCVDEEDIEAMELVEGHVGLGPKDVVVSGFRIFYTCEGDDEPRTITVYLDMAPTHLAPPAGVASFFFQ